MMNKIKEDTEYSSSIKTYHISGDAASPTIEILSC